MTTILRISTVVPSPWWLGLKIWTASRPPNTTAVRPSEGRAVGYRLLDTDV
ncbi:hypothetical protein QFZ55_003782 [Streptomyces luteogriseus]|uniref:hypothetical protein n=1 Tax=Streptomyces luteogriseus TaxID=68233 RepID=UPI0027846EBF|nr:hypothetical protein [Streptomyces luteogriseus]MDQ0714330.1 hypothetical protein [Streptomyces luteogriseus]